MRAADRARLQAIAESGSNAEPTIFVGNSAAKAKANTLFRSVLYTGPEVQLVVMSLLPNEDIGVETHRKVEQVITVASGEAEATLDGAVHALEAGDSIIVPPGTEHNVRNTGKTALRLYTVYSPPNHIAQTRHATKADAEGDNADAIFSRKVNSGE